MTAIAPPPVGDEAEPSVQRDNARALESLRGSAARPDARSVRRAGAGGGLATRLRLPGWSRTAVVSVVGFALAALFAGRVTGVVRGLRRREPWRAARR